MAPTALLSRPAALRDELRRALPHRPFSVKFWDGQTLEGTEPGPTLTARSPRSVAFLLSAPGELGLGRAYVTGELDVDDLDALTDLIGVWKPPTLDAKDRARLAISAVRAAGLQLPPTPPESEMRPQGVLHGLRRDSRAIQHHYDVSNEFYAQLLDDSMTYSCAYYTKADESLEQAQWNKRELICRKLELEAGQRVLDVGCGWGAFVVHAAKEHGVKAVGITLSPEQAKGARERAEREGVADLVEIRVMDYRELADGPYDAIASIGMVEHVGEQRIDLYAEQLSKMLKPGGRLLNHGIARRRHPGAAPGPFSERYVFPDAVPLHLSHVTNALEKSDFSIEHVEGFPENYVRTLTAWIENLDADIPNATRIAGDERVRVWRLYLRASRNGFTSGFASVYQVLAVKPTETGKFADPSSYSTRTFTV
ncbi:MAG: cyclopropane-fatty-acyl-phospholipid synthase family protein [Solirubrobacteraceae bacterium]|nr:cyclopropane-fatty-acyl-phospholipid synthase family protein [Patulibacter sp.]